MRTTTIPAAITVALLALAGCTPTTTEGRPVEAAGSPAGRLHVDVLAGTRPTLAPPHDPDGARRVVAVEAAPPPPSSARVPSATGQLLQAPALRPDAPGRTAAGGDDSPSRGSGWPSDGLAAAAAAVIELERRFTVQGLTVLDVDVRPTALDVNGDAETRVGFEVVVVHTSGHSHPHQSAYLATLANNDDGGWHIVELEARP
jgi:hypothetical protein